MNKKLFIRRAEIVFSYPYRILSAFWRANRFMVTTTDPEVDKSLVEWARTVKDCVRMEHEAITLEWNPASTAAAVREIVATLEFDQYDHAGNALKAEVLQMIDAHSKEFE